MPTGYLPTGFGNTRDYLGSRGFSVGQAAQAANPNNRRMSWRDIAAAAGIQNYNRKEHGERLAQAYHGQNYAGDNASDPETARWRENMEKYFTTGAGAAQLGGPGTPGGAGGGGPNLQSQADKLISDLMGGAGPYTDDVVSGMKANAWEDAAGGISAANRAAMNRASRQGSLYSASTDAEAAQNERAGREGLGRSFRDIESRAAEGNFGAKIQGLQAYQAKIAGERDERMANARNEVERESIRSEYDKAIKTTQMQIDAQRDLQERAQGAAGGAASRARQWELEDRAQARQWQLEDRDYEEPWRYYGLASGSNYEMPIY